MNLTTQEREALYRKQAELSWEKIRIETSPNSPKWDELTQEQRDLYVRMFKKTLIESVMKKRK